MGGVPCEYLHFWCPGPVTNLMKVPAKRIRLISEEPSGPSRVRGQSHEVNQSHPTVGREDDCTGNTAFLNH